MSSPNSTTFRQREHSIGGSTVTSSGENPRSRSSPQDRSPFIRRNDSTGSMRGVVFPRNFPAAMTVAKKQHQGATTERQHSTNTPLSPHHDQRVGSSRQSHERHQDLAQMAAMAMVSLRGTAEECHRHPVSQHPFQPPPPPPVWEDNDHQVTQRTWESTVAENSNADLMLMFSSTQSLSDENNGLDGYGTMPHNHHRVIPMVEIVDATAMPPQFQSQQRPEPLLHHHSSHPGIFADNNSPNNVVVRLPNGTQPSSDPPAPPSLPPPPPPALLIHTPSTNRRHPSTARPLPQVQPAEPPFSSYTDPRQREEIARFASMATPSHQDYLSPHGPMQLTGNISPYSPQYFSSPKVVAPIPSSRVQHPNDDLSSELHPSTVDEFDELDEDLDDKDGRGEDEDEDHKDFICFGSLGEVWVQWLSEGVKRDEEGTAYFEDDDNWLSLAAWMRFIVFNPVYPEFTSVQQAFWAVFIGIVMGFFTAVWKIIIDDCVQFMWKTVPEKMLTYGLLTDLNGRFPLPYYLVLCPAVCGGVLSCINVLIPVKIPGQNEWIQDVHSRGVHDSKAFWYMFFMSTAVMASGMCLGPEGPLVTVGGMFGSKLGLITKQSILQARVLNLTAASAAVAGFFGFPMAGGLFVLELPHRMGLQYFEALTPATVATIVAVLTNRIVIRNDVTGYYTYPNLELSLPSRIFVNAICYGAFGSVVGILYAKGVTKLKILVHGLFHETKSYHIDESQPEALCIDRGIGEESLPLMRDAIGTSTKVMDPRTNRRAPWFCVYSSFCKCTISHEPTRAAVVGTLAGAAVGVVGMFLPHILFWGEEQLQNLIDKGRTPLPVFPQSDQPLGALTAYGWCMIDPNDAQAVAAGFSMGCATLLMFSKIICVGLSLGTGIVAGHFWGPLFCGCAASHFLTDLTTWTKRRWGVGGQIAAYPTVSILCIMGSSHVVTFRAHMAIMTILTLTISAFNDQNQVGVGSYKVAGDYSAVFPLLVVAVYVSFILARDTVFYEQQRSRGDILALPEVLCEPGKVGQPLVVNYDTVADIHDESDHGHDNHNVDDEAAYFAEQVHQDATSPLRHYPSPPKTRPDERSKLKRDIDGMLEVRNSFSSSQYGTTGSSTMLDWDVSKDSMDAVESNMMTSFGRERIHSHNLCDQDRLDELLGQPQESHSKQTYLHRRSQSAPIEQLDLPPIRRNYRDLLVKSVSTTERRHRRGGSRDGPSHSRSGSFGDRSNSRNLVRVMSYGELTNHQPSLLDQARGRSATNVAADARHQRLPSLPKSSTSGRHSRWGSDSSSVLSASVMVSLEASSGALTTDDIERTFSSVVNQHFLQQHHG